MWKKFKCWYWGHNRRITVITVPFKIGYYQGETPIAYMQYEWCPYCNQVMKVSMTDFEPSPLIDPSVPRTGPLGRVWRRTLARIKRLRAD